LSPKGNREPQALVVALVVGGLLPEKAGAIIANSIKRPHRFRRSERMTERQKTAVFFTFFDREWRTPRRGLWLYSSAAYRLSAITRSNHITTIAMQGVPAHNRKAIVEHSWTNVRSRCRHHNDIYNDKHHNNSVINVSYPEIVRQSWAFSWLN